MPCQIDEPRPVQAIPAGELKEVFQRIALGRLPMHLTPDFCWFQWEDKDPGGTFEVTAGDYVIRMTKDWALLTGIETLRAFDGRLNVWDLGWDFSPLLNAGEWDGLMAKVRELGRPAHER